MNEQSHRPERSPEELQAMLTDLIGITNTTLELVEQNHRHHRRDLTQEVATLKKPNLDRVRAIEEEAARHNLDPQHRMKLLHNTAVLSVEIGDMDGAETSVTRFNNMMQLYSSDDPELLSIEQIQAFLAELENAPEPRRRKLGRMVRRRGAQ